MRAPADPPSAPPRAEPRIPAFEGLRGVLALSVALGHFGLNHVLERFGFELRKQLAVFVFFALSGFVLSRAYYFGRRSFPDLALSRVARLFPLHLFAWLWGLALALATHRPLDAVDLGASLLLLHNLGLPGLTGWSLNFPTWSISVEMYLSLLFYVVARRPSPALAAALTLAGLVCAALWASSDRDMIETVAGVNLGLLCGLGGFGVGVAAWIVDRRCAAVFARGRALALSALALTLGFMLLPAGVFHYAGAPFAAATLLLLLMLAANGEATFLASRPFVYLGAISYSIYLLHIPMLLTATAIFGAERMAGGAAKLPLLAATLALAALTHRSIEKPAQAAVLRRFATPRGARA